ncbi:MAG: alpha-E domain-containing protein [Rhodocyclaceae bacterium]|nr:alpha-E domain-containing protein [Rhodocyclaceae bacterium]
MMLSRVAENLYWMGRYLERAENTARFINSTTQVLLDLPRDASFGWNVLLKVAGLDHEFATRHEHADEDSLMSFLVEDEANPSSILSSIQNARENARTVREVLPMEIWERINSLYLYIRDNAPRVKQGRGPRNDVLLGVIGRRESIIGLLTGSMSRDVAYQLIKMGRNLERADMTTRIIDVNAAVQLPADPAQASLTTLGMWMSTLNALSAYQMFRTHVGVHVRGDAVVNYLLRDPHFPRTVLFCLEQIEGSLSVLPDHAPAMRRVRHAWRRLAGMQLDGLKPAVLHEYLDQVQSDLAAIHGAVAKQYFHRHQSDSTGQAQ